MVIIILNRRDSRLARRAEDARCGLAVRLSTVVQLRGARSPCKCQKEEGTSGLFGSTNTRRRWRESSPSLLMCRLHSARDAGSQVSLVFLPCLDSCLKAAGPFVFSGIVCLCVKCLCVLISCTLRAWLTQSFRSKTGLFAVVSVSALLHIVQLCRRSH